MYEACLPRLLISVLKLAQGLLYDQYIVQVSLFVYWENMKDSVASTIGWILIICFYYRNGLFQLK